MNENSVAIGVMIGNMIEEALEYLINGEMLCQKERSHHQRMQSNPEISQQAL